jgi:hypothetical protein
MTSERFLALPLAHAARAVTFRQRAFRRRHFDGDETPALCSALVAGWLHAARTGDDFLASLHDPSPAFLQNLVAAQQASTYPLLTGPEVAASDRAALRARYDLGEQETAEGFLRRLRVPDFAAYDLQRSLGMRTVSLSSFAEAGEDFFRCLLAGDGQPLLLKAVSIRHQTTTSDTTATHRSHRLGIALRAGSWSLFDPNAGHVEFTTAGEAKEWLEAFWQGSPYATWRPWPDVPLLSVYSMT